MWSLHELCGRLAPHLEGRIVVGSSIDPVINFCKLLPRSFPVRVFGFEYVLGEEGGSPDFSLCLDSKDHACIRKQLSLLPDALKRQRGWLHLHNLFSEEVFPQIDLEGLWLEFDTSDTKSSTPIPNCFFCGGSTPRNAEGIVRLASLISPESIFRKEQLDTIDRCYHRSLDVGLRVSFFAFMLGREKSPVKFLISGADFSRREMLAQYLEEIGCPDVASSFRRFFHEMGSLFGHFVLSIDLEETVGHKIGIECYPEGKTAEERKESWERIFRALHRAQVVSASAMQEILGWIGEDVSLFRTINHIKFVFRGEEMVSTKVYLSARVLGATF